MGKTICITGHLDILSDKCILSDMAHSSVEDGVCYLISTVNEKILELSGIQIDSLFTDINFFNNVEITIDKYHSLKSFTTSPDEIEIKIYKKIVNRGYIYNTSKINPIYSFFLKNLKIADHKEIKEEPIIVKGILEEPKKKILFKINPSVVINDSFLEELTLSFKNGTKLNKVGKQSPKNFKSEFQKELALSLRKRNSKRTKIKKQ
jgi:hypothetical protein